MKSFETAGVKGRYERWDSTLGGRKGMRRGCYCIVYLSMSREGIPSTGHIGDTRMNSESRHWALGEKKKKVHDAQEGTMSPKRFER